jgi:hypothetical protein
MADPALTVYGAPWCPHCKRVKRFLAAHRVRYENVDIDERPEAIDRLKELLLDVPGEEELIGGGVHVRGAGARYAPRRGWTAARTSGRSCGRGALGPVRSSG